MKYLKYILFVLLIAIIALAIYIAVQPNDYSVTRTKNIKAPAALVYNEIIDFKNWEDWNAWIEEKPDMKITYPDQTKGVNGSYSWEDEGETGTMTTTNVNLNSSISQEMQFGEYPKSDVNWTFTPKEDGSTDVKWTISGKDLPFGFKAFATLSGGMEKQIGPYYERVLQLKVLPNMVVVFICTKQLLQTVVILVKLWEDNMAKSWVIWRKTILYKQECLLLFMMI